MHETRVCCGTALRYFGTVGDFPYGSGTAGSGVLGVSLCVGWWPRTGEPQLSSCCHFPLAVPLGPAAFILSLRAVAVELRENWMHAALG